MTSTMFIVSVVPAVQAEQVEHFLLLKGKEVYKLKEIMRYCKTKIYAQPIPSMRDVEEAKCEKIMDQLDQIIENEDLTKMVNMIESQIQ